MLKSCAPLFLDCQSTGGSLVTSSLLEVACNERSWVVRQDRPVSPKICRLLGVSKEEIDGGIPVDQMFHDLSALVQQQLDAEGPLLFAVAHYARIERAYIDRLWLSQVNQVFPIPIICTHKITKLLCPGLPSYGLRALAGWFGTPLDDGKRASNHVFATRQIWNALVAELNDRGVHSLQSLEAFLAEPPKAKTAKKQFLITRQTRLALPDCPGVYKYLDRNGRVLYVGKATSLKSRVNSYFTGGCKRDHRKLEMMAQAVEVVVTPTPAPLHAGLLEYDEIKRLGPPYNIVFKGRARDRMRDLAILEGCLEDFDPVNVASVIKDCFHGLDDMDILRQGIELWRIGLGIDGKRRLSSRDLLSLGLPLLREWVKAERIRRNQTKTIALVEDEEDNQSLEVESNDKIWTCEDVQFNCQRIVRRAAREHIRARWLARLADATISFELGSTEGAKQVDLSRIVTLQPFNDENRHDLKRVRVLLHELRRAESRGSRWKVVAPWPMKVPFWI